MESPLEESQVIERALKDLLDHWDKEDRKQFGQRFEERFHLNCSSRWTFQVEKQVGRSLTPEEKTLLDYYYLLFCQRAEAAYLRAFDELEGKIHQLQAEQQDLEEKIHQLQAEQQDLEKRIHQLQAEQRYLAEIRQLRLDLRRLTNRFDN